MSYDPGRAAVDDPAPAGASAGQGVAAGAISKAIVQLLRARAGRGPTTARTALSSELAIVTLRDCLTTGEQTLAADGGSALVLQARRVLHHSMRAEATAIVEEITGRRVIAYLTDQQLDPDVAIVAFLFAPSQDTEAA